MVRPTKQPLPACIEDEGTEKTEILRGQIRDATDDDGWTWIYDFTERRVRAVDAGTAFDLCRTGLASLEDPPGWRHYATTREEIDWGITKRVYPIHLDVESDLA